MRPRWQSWHRFWSSWCGQRRGSWASASLSLPQKPPPQVAGQCESSCARADALGPIGERVGDLEKHVYWLVVWNIFFPYTGNNNPKWLSYVSEGLKPPIKSKNRRRSIMATSIEWLIIATWKTDLSDPRFPPHAADALHTFGTDGTLAEDGCCPGWWILQVIPLWLGGKLLTTLVRYGQHSGKSLVLEDSLMESAPNTV